VRSRVWPAAACVLLVMVGLAPASAAQRALPRSAAPSQPDLPALRAAARRALGSAGVRAGARGRFVVAQLVPSTEASAADAAAVGPPEQLSVGPAIARAYVSWQPPADTGGEPVTGYRVYRGSSAASLAPIGTTTGTAVLDRGLVLSKTYYYSVAALTASGEGERSAAVPVTIPRRELIMSVPTSETSSALVAQARRGAPLVPILDDGHDNVDAVVSPNGNWIAYVSDISGAPSIYRRRADGTGTPRTIAAGSSGPGGANYGHPSWSPDGRWLVVTAESDDATYLFVLDAFSTDGGGTEFTDSVSPSWTNGASVVTVESETGALVERYPTYEVLRRVRSSTARALDAEVSPNGEWIAFSRLDGLAGETPLTSIWLAPRWGGSLTRLAAPGGLNADVAWSRDGKRVYFTHAAVDEFGTVGPAGVMSVARDASGLTAAGPPGVESFSPAHRAVLAPPRAIAPRPPTHVPDFDGDGAHDIGVFRPSTGAWHVRHKFTVTWGRAGDVPVPADFNGNGRSDIAVYRPSNGTWHIRGRDPVTWGRRGDVPVAGDYNGDGRDDIAVWRPSTGRWHIRGLPDLQFGRRGDIPIPAYWIGTPHIQAAVWRPSTGMWFFNEPVGYEVTRRSIRFGRLGDVPIASSQIPVGEHHHMGIFRPSTGRYYEYDQMLGRRESTASFTSPALAFGSVPMGMIWVKGKRPGVDLFGDRALFQPATGLWHGVPDAYGGGPPFIFGRTGDLPL
jgi:hypothetical protein